MTLIGEWTTIDKSPWGAGPWLHEPDKISWIDDETGLDCLMVRHPTGGHWCGYVGVAEGHPAFDQDYEAVHDMAPKDEDGWSSLDVHGGLTFADLCRPEHAPDGSEDPSRGICHVAQPGRPERVYWLGFDCAHAFDLSPAYASRYRDWTAIPGEAYRDRAYVEGEVRSLARQLAAMATARAA